MATVSKPAARSRSTAVARKPARTTVARRASQPAVSQVVAMWLLRQTGKGAGWLVRTTARNAAQMTVHTARQAHSGVKQWASDFGTFGFNRSLAACACGWSGPTDRMNAHFLRVHGDEPMPDSSRFSGHERRANEPIRARAWRMDRPHDTDPATAVSVRSTTEVTVNDPTGWAKGSDVLCAPDLEHPRDLYDYFCAATKSFAPVTANLQQLDEYLGSAGVAEKILSQVEQAIEHAAGIEEALHQAAMISSDYYAEIPDFTKAG